MRRKVWAAALAAAAALGITPMPANAQDQPRLETPRVDWKPCPEGPKSPDGVEIECGSVTVPIDWSRADGPTVDIALARRKATDPGDRIGTLVINPGGPGWSGVGDVRGGGMAGRLPAEVRRRFDIVGFDPRGVGLSHQIRCRPLPSQSADLFFPTTDEQFRRLRTAIRKYGEGCRKVSGPLFDFLDSDSVARDMDAIRAALGEHTLSYYGNSYGTLLGQRYAQLFPRRVRAMVLDSNMDHSRATTWDFLASEAKAVQDGFDQYVAWCRRSTECALHGKDVRRVFAALYARAERGELVDPHSSEPKSSFDLIADAQYAFLGPSWKQLSQDQAKMLASKPRRASTGRPEQGAREETIEDPSTAIFCQDWRLPVRGIADVRAYRRGLAQVAPDMKLPPQAWGATLLCTGWPTATRIPQEPPLWAGVPPVLLLNSRYDPVTPYEWARNVARQTGAALLTYDGWGHAVHSLGSDCVAAATERYLIGLTTPARGTHCPAVEPHTGR